MDSDKSFREETEEKTVEKIYVPIESYHLTADFLLRKRGNGVIIKNALDPFPLA